MTRRKASRAFSFIYGSGDLGPDHPNIAASLAWLCEFYRTEGRYAEAEPLIQRALTIDEKALGPIPTHIRAVGKEEYRKTS